MVRRALPVTLLVALLSILSPVPALAQQFPSKAVRVVVPYPATGIYERHHRRFGFTDILFPDVAADTIPE